MAYRRSLKSLAGHVRSDVGAHLNTTWKHYTKVNGEVVQTLSQYEHKIIAPLFDHLGDKLRLRFKIFFKVYGVAIAAGYFLYKWSTWKNHDIHYHHRD